jgi:hypothetical protein
MTVIEIEQVDQDVEVEQQVDGSEKTLLVEGEKVGGPSDQVESSKLVVEAQPDAEINVDLHDS